MTGAVLPHLRMHGAGVDCARQEIHGHSRVWAWAVARMRIMLACVIVAHVDPLQGQTVYRAQR
jgi:hypothetical protein